MPHLLPLLLICSLAPDSAAGSHFESAGQVIKNKVMASTKTCGFYDVAQNLTILNDKKFSEVRPVRDTRQTTVVIMDFRLYAIVDLDMKSQTLTTFGWFTFKWKNEYLTWDPKDFCGIKRITVGRDSVWKPDLFVTEMTDMDKSPTIQYLYVSSDGTNVRSEPMMIVSTCGMDTYRFPFDTQTCSLTFSSFLHTANEITVKTESNSSMVTKTSKDIFVSKGDWSLLNIDVESYNYSFGGRDWSQVKYEITIERTPSHYVVTMIIPSCFLVLIDMASGFIPMDGHERLGFKITVVLGFSVLLMILNELLPSSQGTPVLEIFCIVCITVMLTSIAGAIFISYLLQQPSTRRVPRWIEICVLKHLANALAIDTKAKHDEDGDDDMSITKETGLQIPSLLTKEANSTEAELLKGILAEMFKMRQDINSNKNGERGSEWYMVAFVFDRLFCALYLITVITIACVIGFIWY